MSNWIKPKKCNSGAVDLDSVCAIERQDFLVDVKRDDSTSFFSETKLHVPPRIAIHLHDSFTVWYYENEADRDYDYQRILARLELK